MYTIYTTEVFDIWFESFTDLPTARRIQARIDRVEEGNFIILLAGGDKSSQSKDIATAQQLARLLKK